MLKQRETYTATKGVENEGYEFEVAMLAFYCFHLCYNEKIKNFKIAIYDDQYHPFDDIVIDITSEQTEKYAIQLKHVKDKLVLNTNHFGKNGKMVLAKYFKYDFSKSDHVVLLTNGVVNEEITAGTCQIKTKLSLTALEECLDTSNEKENHIYEISNEENSNKITFYTSQKNRHDIDDALRENFQRKFYLTENNSERIVHTFKNFFQLWKKGQYQLCKLDKEDIKMKISEILFFEHVVEYKPKFQNVSISIKSDLLQKIFNGFEITILKEADEEVFENVCSFNLDKEELISDGHKLLIIVNGNEFKALVFILWRLKIFPLILKISEDNKRMIYKLIRGIREEKLSFLLVGDASKQDFEDYSVLEHLGDLEGNPNFEKLADEFKLSIQGQKAITLKALVECHKQILEIITTKELLDISKEHFVVGDVDEDLPEPYIPRRLITSILRINAIESFPNDLFAISGAEKFLKQKLPKCKFWKFEKFVEHLSQDVRLSPKSIILCEEKEKSFATCLKYKHSNIHCLKMIDQDHLQLLFSKEKSEHLRQFQILQEEELHEISKNKINLICARPGMGKFTMLKYLRKNCPPGFWTVRVNLQDNQILQESFHDSTFDSKLGNCLKDAHRVIFFFYGIDNLQNDNLIKATDFIRQLESEDFKVWVFSENHLKEALEQLFRVSAMEIEEFSEDEQRRYIQERLKKREVDQGLEKVLKSFKMLKNSDILGAPMHLYMLTEIFINNPKMEKVLILTDIYKYFIKTKYQHYLMKVSSEHHNQIIDDGIYYRTEQYKLAAISCLDFICFNNAHCDRNFLEQIDRIGDVVGIIFKIGSDGSIIFSQQTYADYFAALWLANNHNKVKNIKNFIFRDDFKNIYFMFNLEVCKNYPAHIAVLYQNYQQLQQNEDSLHHLDFLKRSPLHLACSYETKLPKLQSSNEKKIFKFFTKDFIKEDVEAQVILDFLIDKITFDPLQADELCGWNLYDYAFNGLNLYAIESILKIYPNTYLEVLEKLDGLGEDFFTVIYYCVKFGYTNLLKLSTKSELFSVGLQMENCNGESLLYLAVKSQKYETVKILVDQGVNIDTTSAYNKRSALHLAVETNCVEIVKLLLEKEASSDIMDRYRNTPLHLASSKGFYQSAELLLCYKADVNFSDNFGRTSLHFAATNGHIKLVQLLIDNEATIDKCDHFGNTPLVCASLKKFQEIVKILSGNGATQQAYTARGSLSKVDEYTSYQLHWVAFTGQAERIEPLLHDGWDINRKDSLGRTPLYRAVTEKHQKIVAMLSERNANVNISDNNGIVPLCKAIRNEDYKMVELLLKVDAWIDVRDNFSYTPLHWACMVGNLEIVKLLLSKNPELDMIDNFKRKAIDCAADFGFEEIVQLFDCQDAKLEEIAKKQAKFFNHYKKKSKGCNSEHDLPQLDKAIIAGNYKLVEQLLEYETNLNQLDRFGYTYLHKAVIANKKNIVKLLLQKGGNSRVRDVFGSSLLHWAVYCGFSDLVRFLIKDVFDIDVVDGFGYNLVDLGAIQGHDEILRILLKNNCNIGNDSLIWACKNGHIQTVQILVKIVVDFASQEKILNFVQIQNKFLKIIQFE